LADAIEAYKLEVSGSKTTVTASASKTIYCRRANGGVYPRRNIKVELCSSRSDTQITKAEYDRLKNKRTDTVNDASTKDKASGSSESLKAKLKELKDLLDEGLITAEEAAAKRAKLLEDL